MPFSDPSPHAERRHQPRVRPAAYGFAHACAFARGGRTHAASLVDVSSGGARLALADDRPPVAPGESLRLDTRLHSPDCDLTAIPCAVRWTHELEFGVAFAPELPLGVAELQELLTR
jgi:hypothetical protein